MSLFIKGKNERYRVVILRDREGSAPRPLCSGVPLHTPAGMVGALSRQRAGTRRLARLRGGMAECQECGLRTNGKLVFSLLSYDICVISRVGEYV